MNRSIRIVTVLLLISGFISCKKNGDSDSNNTRLYRMQIFYTNPAKGELNYEFIYDDQKRVSKIVVSGAASLNDQTKFTIFQCFYNGNDINPYKTIGPTAYAINYPGEIYHNYNSSGDLIQDSIPPQAPSNLKIIRNYNYYTDKIVVQTRKKSDTYGETFKDSFLLADHNIKEVFINIGLLGNLNLGHTHKYDNKINPFSTLNISTLTTTGALIDFPSYMAAGYCKNNITEYIEGQSTGPGIFTGQNTFNFNYTYNNKDMPTECRYTNFSGSYVIKYYYTN